MAEDVTTYTSKSLDRTLALEQRPEPFKTAERSPEGILFRSRSPAPRPPPRLAPRLASLNRGGGRAWEGLALEKSSAATPSALAMASKHLKGGLGFRSLDLSFQKPGLRYPDR